MGGLKWQYIAIIATFSLAKRCRAAVDNVVLCASQIANYVLVTTITWRMHRQNIANFTTMTPASLMLTSMFVLQSDFTTMFGGVMRVADFDESLVIRLPVSTHRQRDTRSLKTCVT